MKITSRQFTALVVAVLMGLMAVWYSYLIATGAIAPVLATWLIFFTATSLGLWTYFRADKEKRDPITNIANTADVAVCAIILSCILLLGKSVRFDFNTFEYVCLGCAGLILFYYIWKRNARVSNIAVNGLLVVGYFPTIVHLWTTDHNTESFAVWSVVWVAAATALYNPIKEKDFLAGLYASRALVLVSIVLSLMVRLELG